MKLVALLGLLAGTAEAMSCAPDRVELLPARGVIPTQPVLVLTLYGIAAEQQPTGLVCRSGTKAIAATVAPVQAGLRQRVRRYLVRQYFVRAATPLEPGDWRLEATELVSGPFTTATQARYTVRSRPMPAVFVGPVRFLGFGTDDPSDRFARVAATAPSVATVLVEVRLEGLHYSRTVLVGSENGEAHFGDLGCWQLPLLPNGRHLTVTVTPIALDGLRGDPTSFELDVPNDRGVNDPTEEELEALDAGMPKQFVPTHLNAR